MRSDYDSVELIEIATKKHSQETDYDQTVNATVVWNIFETVT